MLHNRARMRQTTPLQQAASRSNGAKSRGPKTAAGKRRSSRNGCKHNLFSRVAPLPPADDPEFLANLADYRAHYQPRTFEAESAVLSLAVNMWLKMRLWPIHTEMWEAEIRRQAALHPDEEPRVHAAFALQHPSLQLLQRMDARYGRHIFRALDTLEREEKLAIRAERLRLRAEKTAKIQHQTPPQPGPAGTRDFSRVPPPQQETPAAPKNIKNEAPNLPVPSGSLFRAIFRRKNNENEAPNLTATRQVHRGSCRTHFCAPAQAKHTGQALLVLTIVRSIRPQAVDPPLSVDKRSVDCYLWPGDSSRRLAGAENLPGLMKPPAGIAAMDRLDLIGTASESPPEARCEGRLTGSAGRFERHFFAPRGRARSSAAATGCRRPPCGR